MKFRFKHDFNEALLNGATEGDVAAVQKQIDRGADVNFKTSEGFTPLMVACWNGYENVAELLVESYANADDRNNNGETALMLAVQKGEFGAARFLLSVGASVQTRDRVGRTPLFFAAGGGGSWLGFSTLVHSSEAGGILWKKQPRLVLKPAHLDLVDLLIGNGGDVNVLDNSGHSVLMEASGCPHRELICKSDGGLVMKEIESPLYLDMVRLLVERGANINAKTKMDTALKVAVERQYDDIAEFLLSRGAQPDMADDREITALMKAAMNGNLRLVRLLIESGANIDKQDDIGFTALIWALDTRQSKVAELLIERGANVNIEGDRGWTALMYAAQNGETEVAKLLLQKGADPLLGAADGFSSESLAVDGGYTEILKLLREKLSR